MLNGQYIQTECSVCKGDLDVPAAQYYQVGAFSSWRHRYSEHCREVLEGKERETKAKNDQAVKPREIW